MKKLNRNQWIAVCVTVVVGVIFYSTGDNIIAFFSNTTDTHNSKNTQTMNSHSAPNNSFSSSVSGFEIQDIVIGTGKEAVPGKTLVVNYSGALTDGKVFDTSIGRAPFTFTLGAGQVIPGWEKGFAGMKVGGMRRLVIPSAYAYGPQGVAGVIPPNATLVFEVTLLDVK